MTLKADGDRHVYENAIEYTYDANGNLTKQAWVRDHQMSSTDPVSQFSQSFSYNAANRISGISSYYAYQGALQSLSVENYAYQPDGNIYQKRVSGSSNYYVYTYNDQGRLSAESIYLSDGSESSATLDYYSNDNITSRDSVYGPSRTVLLRSTYSYDKADHLLNETKSAPSSGLSMGTITYTYDDAGNLLIKATNGTVTASYTYDAFNRMASATVSGTTTYYEYDGLDRRYSKTTGTTVTRHIWRSDEIVYEDVDGVGYTYWHGAYAEATFVGNNMYINLVGQNGNVQEVYNLTTSGVSPVRESSQSYTAYGGGTTASVTPFRYTGEYRDAETGFLYLRARYYDPSMCRFTQEDTYRAQWGLYTYCDGNPLNRTDPSGHCYTFVQHESIHPLYNPTTAHYDNVSYGKISMPEKVWDYDCGNEGCRERFAAFPWKTDYKRTSDYEAFWKNSSVTNTTDPSSIPINPRTPLYQTLVLCNYRHNSVLDDDPDTTTRNRLVTDQPSMTDGSFQYGICNGSWNACEAIAIHNANILQGRASSLSETIYDIQIHGGMMMHGILGTNPLMIGQVLDQYGVEYLRISSADQMSLYGTYIISFWNGSPWLSSLHTVAVSHTKSSGYVTYNYDYRNPILYAAPESYAKNFICGYYLL